MELLRGPKVWAQPGYILDIFKGAVQNAIQSTHAAYAVEELVVVETPV